MTYLPPPPVLPLETVFSRAWALYRRNWIVALPLVFAGVLMLAIVGAIFVLALGAVVHAASGAPSDRNVPPWFLAAFCALYVLLIPVAIWATAATYGMANAAWERGTATFADGNRAFRTRGGALLLAFIGIMGLGIAALILALPTLFISFLALIVFVMYVVPAVIVGRGGFEAIGESFRLVRTHFGRSAIGLLMLIALQYAVSFVAYPIMMPVMLPFQMALLKAEQSGAVPPVPSPGFFFAMGGVSLVLIVLLYAYYGYYALVLTGMYRSVAFPEAPESRADAG